MVITRRGEDPIQRMKREKHESIIAAYQELESFRSNKIKLQRPVFFVPGWTGEDSGTWTRRSRIYTFRTAKYYRPIKAWIADIIQNPASAIYVTFSDQESKVSSDFIELGRYLKMKVVSAVGESDVDLVGHSMGGLTIRAACTEPEPQAFRANAVVTIGTSNNGNPEFGLLSFDWVKSLASRFIHSAHHRAQLRSMYEKSVAMTRINSPESRGTLLKSVNSFWVLMGMKDLVVRGSPKLSSKDVSESLFDEKVRTLQIIGAEHTGGRSLTQDPRVILPVIKILCGLSLENNTSGGFSLKYPKTP